VTLGGKSPEPVSFAAEATLGTIIVPTTGVFPGKVFCTKCTEEEFVIGQVLRCSGISSFVSSSSNPFLVAFPFPSVISSGSRQVGILGEKN
jgi:hypothetical protein